MTPVSPSSPTFVSFRQLLARRLIVFGIFILAVLAPFSSWVVQTTFDDLEKSYAVEKLTFVEKFLESEERTLRMTSLDYGNWQASFNAVRGKNPMFYTKDLRRDDLINFNVQAMGLFDANGQLKSWAPQLAHADTLLPSIRRLISNAIVEHTKTLPSLPANNEGKHENAHFAWTKVQWVNAKPYPLLIALAPILSATPTQEHAGWVVFVRVLDERYLDTLQAQMGIAFTVKPWPAHAKDEKIRIVDNRIVGLKRLSQNDDFAIRIQIEPRWQQERLRMFGTMLLSVFIFLFLLMLFGYLLVENTILSRLHALTKSVRQLQMDSTMKSLPIQPKRTDEIDVLAKAINNMLGQVAKANEQLSHDSRHDTLTGLANRRDLMLTFAQLKEQMKQGELGTFGLILLDLNGFKPINDTLGHEAGDKVLQTLAERFRAMSTPALRFFRLGGDEFAVLLLNVSEECMASAIPTIRATIETPMNYEGKQLHVGAAFGSTLAKANIPWSHDSVLRAADMAMYDNKRRHHRTLEAANHDEADKGHKADKA